MKLKGWVIGVLPLAFLAMILVPTGYDYVAKRSYKTEAISQSTDHTSVEVATFAGGCFWCMEPPFEKLAGVNEVISGYTGGDVMNPSYEEVASGTTGHLEAVRVVYDPKVISYEKLLDGFGDKLTQQMMGVNLLIAESLIYPLFSTLTNNKNK
jgi:peptide methionine sulfoxide reductase msrA/msrB